MPPFLLSGARFLLVGLLLLAWTVWRTGWGLEISRREVLLAAGTGLGLFFAGQGSASWSSQYLDPGVLAVLVSTIPLWAAPVGRAAFGSRIGLVGCLGLMAGFAGVAFLAWPGRGSTIALLPTLFAIGGAASWGAALVVVSRTGIGHRPVVITALQTLVGGALQIVVALASGEAGRVSTPDLVAALPAFASLVVVSSLVGLTLLTWLLSEVRVDIANTASYIAPVIALGLGWLLLGETVSLRTVGGVAVILVGVALMVWSARPRHSAEAEPVQLDEIPELAA